MPTIIGTNGVLETSDVTTTNVPMPTGLAAGHFAGIAILTGSSVTFTTPSGWTLLKVGGSFSSLAVFYQIVSGTPPTSTAVSWNISTTAGALSFAYSGVDAGSPIDSSATAVVDGASQPISTTTIHNNALLVMLSGIGGASGSLFEATPSGWIREGFSPTPSSSNPQMFMFDQGTSTPGTKSETTPSQGGGSTFEETYLFSLNPLLTTPICMII